MREAIRRAVRRPPRVNGSQEKIEMKPRLIALLQHLDGWRLWVLFSLSTVVAAELIVSAMDLLLMGTVTTDYLLTGLVAAGMVAPASLYPAEPSCSGNWRGRSSGRSCRTARGVPKRG
jgi:hypothetical protein